MRYPQSTLHYPLLLCLLILFAAQARSWAQIVPLLPGDDPRKAKTAAETPVPAPAQSAPAAQPAQTNQPAKPSQPASAAAAKVFKIGFAQSDPSDPLNGNWFRTLERRLNQPEYAEILRAAGYTQTAAIEAEGVRDLIQRLDHNEFDLAFCPSVAFIQQNGNYQVVDQLRPPGVFSSRGEMVYLRSCILLGPHHPLFEEARNLQPEQIAGILRNEPIAFVSPYSAAGYLYPLLMMKREYGVEQPAQYYFYQSPEAVIKALCSGLANVGACEFSALLKMQQEAVQLGAGKDQIAFVLKQSPAKIPADPIVFRTSLAGSRQPATLELIQALERAIQTHFQENPRTKNYAIQRASDAIYIDLEAADAELREPSKAAGKIPAGGN